jgi:hypothetical protein
MSARDELRAQQEAERERARTRNNRAGPGQYECLFDDKGKLLLPEVPERSDIAGLCAWLTSVFNLDPGHSITGGRREGLRGPDGHVVLTRGAAAPIRFEPAAKINSPTKLIETLSWRMIESDGAVHALNAGHCRQIAHVVRMLCGAHEAMSDEQEAAGIVRTFMQGAVAVNGRTSYEPGAGAYEAAVALRRELDEMTGRQIGPARYLIDESTGEMVIAVSDLQEAARRHVGSSLPRGWLDARLKALEWQRITIDGHALPGRAGRQGPHATVIAYRGHLRPDDDIDPVTK